MSRKIKIDRIGQRVLRDHGQARDRFSGQVIGYGYAVVYGQRRLVLQSAINPQHWMMPVFGTLWQNQLEHVPSSR